MAFTSLISSLKKAWNGTLRHLMVSEPETVQCFEQSQCTLKNLESTLNAIPDLMFELDAQGRHCDFRALRPETLVAPPKELLGHTVAEVMPPAAAASVMSALEEAANTGFSQGNRIHLPTPMGERYFEFSIARKEQIPDEGSRFIVISRDITERHRKFEEAEHLANFDGLTDLPNRRSMQERLQLAIEAGQGAKGHQALMFIDLDNFKELNDSKGHHTGDLLLKRIAERLKGAVRSTDVVARWGGDEFVVLIQGLHEDTSRAEKQARLRCSQLLKRLEPTYNLEGFSYTCGVSIGISLFDGSAQDPDEILNQADLAMYEAKQGLAAHSYHFFADSPVTSI